MDDSATSDDWMLVDISNWYPRAIEETQYEAKQRERLREAEEQQRLQHEALRLREEFQKSEYVHVKLKGNTSFRLLVLRSGTDGSPIHCELVNMDLESTPPYRAVSYVWGTDDTKHVIYIGGRWIKVRNNLHALLIAVRHDKNDCRLWIDALCIDQSCVVERNEQIKLMGQIYANANNVLAWLGPEDHSINYAFDFIFRAAREGVVKYCQSQPIHDLTLDRYTGLVSKVVIDKWEHDWQCFAKFCSLEYWTRKWIIQELILARSIVLQAGNRQLVMGDVETFFDDLQQNPYLDSKRMKFWDEMVTRLATDFYASTSKTQIDSSFEPVSHLQRLPVALLNLHRRERRDANVNVSSKFQDLIQRYEIFKCKEPCDNIYALYNLIGEHRKHLRVDYELTSFQRAITIMEFIFEHEPYTMTPTRSVAFVNFLLYQLNDGKAERVRSRDGIPGASTIWAGAAMALDYGEAVPEEASPNSLDFRRSAPALQIMPHYSLKKLEGGWGLPDNVEHETMQPLEGSKAVGPEDLVYFSILSKRYFGLATCWIKPGHRVWRFKFTSLAFIVRQSTFNEQPEIVGRALIFPSSAQEDMDQIEDPPSSSGPTSATTKVDQEQEFMCQFFSVTPADIVELAYWTGSTGLANTSLTPSLSFRHFYRRQIAET